MANFLGITPSGGNQVVETRSDGSSQHPVNEDLLSVFGMGAHSRVTVTEAKALGLPALYAAIKIKADALAGLPFNVYQEDNNGNRRLKRTHPVNRLLAYRPYKYVTPFQFRWTMQALLELRGNAIAHIIRHPMSNRPTAFKILQSNTVYIEELSSGDLYYKWTDPVSQEAYEVSYLDVIHLKKFSINSIKGRSIVSLGRDNLALAIAAQDFEAAFFGNNAHVDGFLSHPEKLVKKQKKRIGKAWARWQAGVMNAFKTPILEGGMTYHKVGSNPDEALLSDSKKLSVEDISRWTGVPLHMLGAANNQAYNSVEHYTREFKNSCLGPETTNWKNEFNLKCFREDELYTTETDFDFSELLKGDMEKLSAYIRTLFTSGMVNIDEGRRMIGLNALNTEFSKKHWLQLNIAPANKKERKQYAKSDKKGSEKAPEKTPVEGKQDKT